MEQRYKATNLQHQHTPAAKRLKQWYFEHFTACLFTFKKRRLLSCALLTLYFLQLCSLLFLNNLQYFQNATTLSSTSRNNLAMSALTAFC